MFTVTAAFETLQPRSQDLPHRDDAMALARNWSRVSELEVLVTPKGARFASCAYRDGRLVRCLCPDGASRVEQSF